MNSRPRLFSRNLLLTVFLSAVFLTTAQPALGQTTQLIVKVTDPGGNAVAGATVKAINKVTKKSVTGVTSADGTVVLVVPVGEYDVTVESTGYAKSVVKDLKVTVTETQVTAMTLEPALQPVPPLTISREGNQAASALPNQNNDLTPALDVVIGTVTTGATSLGRVVVDGKGADQQTTRLDGVDFNLLTEMPSSDPTIDALGSFTSPQVAIDLDKVAPKRGPFEARFGPGTGAVSEISSFDSTDRPKRIWVAEIFGQLRNDEFNARNYFDYEERNGLRSGRFGAKGGRGLDDEERTWIFIGYEGARARTERNVYEAVPVDARGCCAIGPMAQFLQGYLPAGTDVKEGGSSDSDFLLARRRVKTTVNANAFNGRFEFLPFIGTDPKAATKITVRYTRQGTENLVPDGVTGRKQRQNILFNNLLASYYFKSSLATSHTIWFGLNQTRARVNVETLSETNPSLAESIIALSGSVSPVGVIGQPSTVPVSTLGGLAKGVGRGFRHENLSTSIAYGIEHKFEKHTLLGGIEGRMLRLNVDRLGGLTYSFPNLAALRAGTPNQITFLSDLSGPAPFSAGNGARRPQQNYLLGYIQMQSRIGRPVEDPTNGKTQARFSVTYGLRYDYFGVVRERDNRAAVFDPATGSFLPDEVFYKAEKLNLQPRVSVAWRLGANGTKLERTIFRFGAGVYSGVPRPGDFLLPIESDRFSTGIKGGVFPISPSVIIDNFRSSDFRQIQPLAFSRDFVGIERLYKWEGRLIQNWRGYDFGILYTGNVGRNLPLARIANKIVSVTTNVDPTKDAIVIREFDTVRDGQPVRPFAEFFFRTSDGHSSYNAMTISFGRNADAIGYTENTWLHNAVRGLGVQYTLSRNVGNASGTLVSNPFDAEADFGHNAAHPRHSFRITSVYDLWKGPTKNPTKDPHHPLWGWRLSSLLKISSGIPFVVRLTRPDVVYVDAAGTVFSGPAVGRTAVINTPGGGASGDSRVPNLLPGANPYLRNGLQFLNPAAFAIPAPGEFGNLKRGALRGPSVAQLDLSLRKNLYDGEGEERIPFSAQFQIDIFNVFNHANFGLPVATLRDALGTNNDQVQPGVAFTQTAARNFGLLNSADPGRVIQFSLTLRLKNGFTGYKESK